METVPKTENSDSLRDIGEPAVTVKSGTHWTPIPSVQPAVDGPTVAPSVPDTKVKRGEPGAGLTFTVAPEPTMALSPSLTSSFRSSSEMISWVFPKLTV